MVAQEAVREQLIPEQGLGFSSVSVRAPFMRKMCGSGLKHHELTYWLSFSCKSEIQLTLRISEVHPIPHQMMSVHCLKSHQLPPWIIWYLPSFSWKPFLHSSNNEVK